MRGWTVIFEPESEVFHYAGGTIDKIYSNDSKRQQREKVRTLYVLKNISDRRMLGNFFVWTILRLGKAIVTLDRPRLGAYWDTALLLPRIWKSRRKVQKERVLSDRAILQKLRSNDA